jgi:transcription-repair coupling factor (superfamily II helicase)
MKVVFFEDWSNADERVKGATDILRQLANLAESRKAA